MQILTTILSLIGIYFLVAIFIPKKLLFFIQDEDGRKRWIAIVGMFASYMLCLAIASVTPEGKAALAEAEKEAKERELKEKQNTIGTDEWYAKMINDAVADSSLYSHTTPKEVNVSEMNGKQMASFIGRFTRYSNIDDSIKAYFDKNERLSSLARNNAKEGERILSKLLPAMRKRFAEELAEKGWEDNLEVEIKGKGNTTLTLIKADFASNRAIKNYQTQLEPIARRFEFRRVEYKWIKHDPDYQYYTLEYDD